MFDSVRALSPHKVAGSNLPRHVLVELLFGAGQCIRLYNVL